MDKHININYPKYPVFDYDEKPHSEASVKSPFEVLYPKYGNYENFSINKMKKLKDIEILSTKAKLLVLKDGRLLIYYDKMINIYNLNNNNLDITYTDDKIFIDIQNAIQMDDGYLIVSTNALQVFKIKEKELIRTYLNFVSSKKVFKLSNNIILYKNYDGLIQFMKYQNGELEELKEKPIKLKHITNILEINDNELALYYKDMNFFSKGYSTYIYFYDRIKNKKKN